MANTQQITAPFIFPGQAANFGDWLFSSLHPKPDGGFDLTGAPGYPGALSPDLAAAGMLFPQVWGAWNPQGGAGQDFLKNYFGSGAWQATPQIGAQLQNIFQYGGPSGPGTDYMNLMAQYGGVGAPGQAMGLAQQYGAPSQAGQPIGLTSQFGGYGDWGNMLRQRAQGGGAAANFMMPFLLGQLTPYQPNKGAGWQAPKMPPAYTGGR